MTLYKFTLEGKDIYINVERIVGVRQSYPPPPNLGSLSGHVGVSPSYAEPGQTTIMIEGHQQIFIDQHISEVLAILEGRDPRPAKILYGKKE